jgi:hypothetical protein
MEEQREIEFTEEEILLLQNFLRKRLGKEPHNSEIIQSILQKLSGAETEILTISPEPNTKSAEMNSIPVITGDHNIKPTLIQRLLQKLRVAV